MDTWTIQMGQYRLAKQLGIPLLDTTVKSGDKVFAPSWEIVLGVKSGDISPEEYTEQYTHLMQTSFMANQSHWLHICNMPEVAIACYCKSGVFCHRHLLVKMFEKICTRYTIPFNYRGEINKLTSTGESTCPIPSKLP